EGLGDHQPGAAAVQRGAGGEAAAGGGEQERPHARAGAAAGIREGDEGARSAGAGHLVVDGGGCAGAARQGGAGALRPAGGGGRGGAEAEEARGEEDEAEVLTGQTEEASEVMSGGGPNYEPKERAEPPEPGELVVEDRLRRIDDVVSKRTRTLAVVLDQLEDAFN